MCYRPQPKKLAQEFTLILIRPSADETVAIMPIVWAFVRISRLPAVPIPPENIATRSVLRLLLHGGGLLAMLILGTAAGRYFLSSDPRIGDEWHSSAKENTLSAEFADGFRDLHEPITPSADIQLVSFMESEIPSDTTEDLASLHEAAPESSESEATTAAQSPEAHSDDTETEKETEAPGPAAKAEAVIEPDAEQNDRHPTGSDSDTRRSPFLPGSGAESHGQPHDQQSAHRAPGSEEKKTSKKTTSSRPDEQPTLPATDFFARQMAQADDDLCSGSYAHAIRIYQRLKKDSTSDLDPALEFRLALCAEVSGNHAEATEAYLRIGRNTSGKTWAGAAAFGAARCMSSLGRHDALQSDLLRRVLLDETAYSVTIRSELLHLLGRVSWKCLAPTSDAGLLDDNILSDPDWHPEPHVTLKSLAKILKEAIPTRPELQLTTLSASEKQPAEIFLRVHSTTAQTEKLLKLLVEHCSIPLEVTPSASTALEGRTLQIHVSDRSLALLLDGLTVPFDNIWKFDGSRIQVSAADESSAEQVRSFKTAVAERILRAALAESPASQQSGCSRLALGSLLYSEGQTADAGQMFLTQLRMSPFSAVEPDAAFNLGKCQLALKQPDDARNSFLQSVDAKNSSADVQLAAYLYAGRLQIEMGKLQPAITTLMHALSMSDGTSMEPQAAMLLASCYLLTGNPQGASSVLTERREALQEEEYLDASAFLSSLCRFRAAILPDRKEREGRSVVEAIAHLHPEKQFGAHWCFLAAEAAEELGLTQQATEGYLQTLQLEPARPLRDQTLMKLAQRFQADQRLDDAHLLLTAVTPEESETISQMARLQNAELAIEQGKPETAVRYCRELLDRRSTPELRRETLRIMGRAYERLKNHRAAVYCFSGIVPDAAVEAAGYAETVSQDAQGVHQ
jgi:tetratricopeptide (TPR) repeat protein